MNIIIRFIVFLVVLSHTKLQDFVYPDVYIFGSNNFHGIPSVLPVPEARCARLSDLALAVAAAAYQRTLVPSGVGEVWQVSGLSLRKSGCNWNCLSFREQILTLVILRTR